MKIEVGQKIRGHEIVWVSEDKRVFGVHTPDNLGSKGRIWGKMHFQKLSLAEREEFWNAGFQIQQFNDMWYMVLERCADYAEIFTKCRHLVTDKSSIYAYPEPIVYET